MLHKDVGSKSFVADIRNPKAFRVGDLNKLYWLKIALIVWLDSLAISAAWAIATKLGTSVSEFSLIANDRNSFSWLWPIVLVNLVVLCASGLYQNRRLLDLLKTLCLAHVTLLLVAYLIDPGVWV
ncbi:MAG: hypothetical protein ACRC2V_02095, partial [Xenococcaceae cyanobacterium]